MRDTKQEENKERQNRRKKIISKSGIISFSDYEIIIAKYYHGSRQFPFKSAAQRDTRIFYVISNQESADALLRFTA